MLAAKFHVQRSIHSNFLQLLGTEVERLTLYRAVRSTEMAKRFYSLPSPGKEDVEFDLIELERVKIGEPFAVIVDIKNKSSETRTIQAILSAGSVYYNGVKAHLVKRASGDFVLQPNAGEKDRFSYFFSSLTFTATLKISPLIYQS